MSRGDNLNPYYLRKVLNMRLGKRERRMRRDAFKVRADMVRDNMSEAKTGEKTLTRSYSAPAKLGGKAARFHDPYWMKGK